MNVYTGSNDVLYWLYNSHQISKGKTGIYLLIFGIFTFWWGLAPLWQHFGCWFLCYPSLVELYYVGWYWDNGVRKETLYLPKFWSLATLNFEIWINQIQNSFVQIQKVKDWTFNKKNTSGSANVNSRQTMLKAWKGTPFPCLDLTRVTRILKSCRQKEW